MKILLTNDDGVDAPGILAFEKAMVGFGLVTVVAPSGALSGCGHRVTTDEALQVKQIRPGIMSVDGTPADCVRVALHSLLHFMGFRVLQSRNIAGGGRPWIGLGQKSLPVL